MGSFEEAWAAVAESRRGESPSHELRPLLQRVYLQTLSKPIDKNELKRALTELLEYLSGAGRTNANCWATDLFFCIGDRWEAGWEDQELTDDFRDVFAHMGEALHDTVQAPNVAENFGCLPEQLLESVQKIVVD